MTESGWFRIVPQQSGEVSLNHQGKRVWGSMVVRIHLCHEGYA